MELHSNTSSHPLVSRLSLHQGHGNPEIMRALGRLLRPLPVCRPRRDTVKLSSAAVALGSCMHLSSRRNTKWTLRVDASPGRASKREEFRQWRHLLPYLIGREERDTVLSSFADCVIHVHLTIVHGVFRKTEGAGRLAHIAEVSFATSALASF